MVGPLGSARTDPPFASLEMPLVQPFPSESTRRSPPLAQPVNVAEIGFGGRLVPYGRGFPVVNGSEHSLSRPVGVLLARLAQAESFGSTS
jgi:hypothetical protein